MALVVSVALVATPAFILPMATPPERDRLRFRLHQDEPDGHCGLWLNLVGIVRVTLTVLTLGQWVLGIHLRGTREGHTASRHARVPSVWGGSPPIRRAERALLNPGTGRRRC
jgi:hypothetical protein